MSSETPNDQSTSSILGSTLSSVSSLIRNEVDLARAEISENLNRAVVAIGLLVGAVVLALVALNILANALVIGLADIAGISVGWSALIVGGALAAGAALLVAKGVRDLKLTSIAPTRTGRSAKRDAKVIKEGISS